MANPGDRFPWTVVLRDLAFGGGAFALAATQTEDWRAPRSAATWLGLLLLLLTALIYAPILATAVDSPEMIEGLNYVADTLLFAGTVLLLAGALHDHTGPDRAGQLSTAPSAS